MKTQYDSVFTAEMKKSIARYEVISFDIFDTLLLRPFLQPTDLFYYMEEKYGLEGFAACRIQTEQVVRSQMKDTEEITLSEIYECMPSYQDAQQLELDTEAELLYCNYEMKEVYDLAVEQKKTVLIVSDIYLSEEFISAVLNKNGYSQHHRLFVSSAWKKEKWTGNLFRTVLHEMNIKPSAVLHIGDNSRSDLNGACMAGIDALLYKKVSEQNKDRHQQGFFRRKKADTEYSVIAMQLADRCRSPFGSYWERFGYEFAGPFVYAYACWIKDYVARNSDITDLVFVARDGYLLQKAYGMIDPDSRVRSHYVYAPRAVNLKYLLEYGPGFSGDGERAKYIISEYRFLFPNMDVSRISGAAALALLSGNRDKIQNAAGLEFEKYRKYIAGLGFGKGKVAVVDSITDKFSSQNVIEHVVENQVVGLYWMVLRDGLKNAGNKKFVCFQKEHYFRLCSWDIIEFILSSPESPICGVEDGMPVYHSGNPFENRRKEIFGQMEDSALEYVVDRMKRKVINYDPKADTMIDWVNDILCNPTESDLENFRNIYFSINADHTDMIPLQPFVLNKITEKTANKMKMYAHRHAFIYKLGRGFREAVKAVLIKIPGKVQRLLFRPLIHGIVDEVKKEMEYSRQRQAEQFKNEMLSDREALKNELLKEIHDENV